MILSILLSDATPYLRTSYKFVATAHAFAATMGSTISRFLKITGLFCRIESLFSDMGYLRGWLRIVGSIKL